MLQNKVGKPHNLEAEQAILGCILIDRDIQADIIQSLAESDFYEDSHKHIISAMRLVYSSGKPVDFVTLSDALEKSGNLEKAGGINYITTLTRITPSAANYKYYLKIVKRDSIHRNLIDASNTIIEIASTSSDPDDSISRAEKLIYDISNKLDGSKLVNLNDVMAYQQVISKFETIAQDKNAFKGLMTGFNKLDNITNGLQKSDLVVLAARPGVGKTSLAMNIVENIAVNQNKVCAVFSLEMPKIQLAQRLICAHARIDMSKALSGKLDLDKDFKKLWAANEQLSKSKIFVDDSSIITPPEILSKCRRLKAKHGLDMVMIDYIQLMESGNKKIENRQQEISQITRNLKILAKEIDVPVVALSQLRRMSGEPQLTDLRESGAIEQDADIVLFIHRPYMEATEAERAAEKIDPRLARIKIAKHRNGGLGIIDLRFIEASTRFVNYEQDEPTPPPSIAREKSANTAGLNDINHFVPYDINEAVAPESYNDYANESAATDDSSGYKGADTNDSEVFD